MAVLSGLALCFLSILAAGVLRDNGGLAVGVLGCSARSVLGGPVAGVLNQGLDECAMTTRPSQSWSTTHAWRDCCMATLRSCWNRVSVNVAGEGEGEGVDEVRGVMGFFSGVVAR